MLLSFHAGKSARSIRKPAKASNVICEQPLVPAKRTISGQRCGGMAPRVRQVLTVESGKPSPAETAALPPKSSMVESTVIEPGEAVMTHDIICDLQTCQEFATCKQTFPLEHDAICIMRIDTKDDQFRAKVTRAMLNFDAQDKFCLETHIDKSSWNLVEKGRRNISLGIARKIKKYHNISLDWTLDGDLHALRENHQKKVRLALAGRKFSTGVA
jgi:hypothetical protein